MSAVVTVLLSHQKRPQLQRVIELWERAVGAENVLLTYGGPADEFSSLAFPNRAFVADELLRVPDQQRNYQSWRGVLRAAHEWLQPRPRFEFVHLVEYDHIPLISDLHQRLVARLEAENADVIAHHLQRIDGTSHPHYLFHASDERFHRYFASVSVRPEKQVVLSMLPTGSLWTREAFAAVASRPEAVPVYVELYLPTQAHHLGFRVRDLPDQNRFVLALGDRGVEIGAARAAGAWTLHPVKTLPQTI